MNSVDRFAVRHGCGSTVLSWMLVSDAAGCVSYESVEIFMQGHFTSVIQIGFRRFFVRAKCLRV